MTLANEPSAEASANPTNTTVANNVIDVTIDADKKTATSDNSDKTPDKAPDSHSKLEETIHAPSRVAMVQMCSGQNPKKNIARIVKFIKRAKAKGAQLVAFPEVCNIMERDKNKAWDVLFLEENDPYLITIKDLAKELGIWVLLGSYLVKANSNNDDEKKFYNRSLLVSDKGEIVARYDKIHLFDIDLAGGETYRESSSVVAGRNIVTSNGPFDAKDFGRLGLSVCYDLRFPYLYRKLNHLGAGIIFVPSAFTATTGRAHWHSLPSRPAPLKMPAGLLHRRRLAATPMAEKHLATAWLSTHGVRSWWRQKTNALQKTNCWWPTLTLTP